MSSQRAINSNVREIRQTATSLAEVCQELNSRGITTLRGKKFNHGTASKACVNAGCSFHRKDTRNAMKQIEKKYQDNKALIELVVGLDTVNKQNKVKIIEALL